MKRVKITLYIKVTALPLSACYGLEKVSDREKPNLATAGLGVGLIVPGRHASVRQEASQYEFILIMKSKKLTRR
jgi:hypothetical protein